MTNYESIPKALANTPQWLAYRLIDTGKGRLSKPPFSPRTGLQCAKNDEQEFTTLQEAVVGAERYDMDGVGFVFTNGFIAIDLDECFGEDGKLLPVPQDIFDHFTDTYWEYSPSGNGLHGFMYGRKPNERTKDTAFHIEVYSGYNFVTVTGDHVEGTNTDAVDMQDALDWLYDKYLPPIVSPNIDFGPVDHGDKSAEDWLALGLSKDDKLGSLYNATEHIGDESSSDFALLCKLAYWLNRDEKAITNAFMSSPWVRTKDAAHTKKLKREDYLARSVDKAIRLTAITACETSRQYETKAIRFFMGTPQVDGTETFPIENYTDLGNAEAMAEVFRDGLCYTEEWGWCFFNGTRWEVDVTYRAMEAARDIAHGLMLSATDWLERVRGELDEEGVSYESDEGKRRLAAPMAFYKHALKSQSEHGLTAMVNLNKAYMIASAHQFNADPWLLNTPRGVVDLKTGEMMPHAAKYHLTNMTSVAPEHKPTPLFDAFLQKIFCGDQDLIDFVQVQLGSALIGKVYTENLIIANGIGSNGKSTLFNTIQYILGDYATSIDPDLLMSSKSSEQQIGMAMLQGKRFAVAQETEEGQRLKTSMLKRLVSTDTKVAKRLYHNPHEFVPAHTLVLSTNHLPKVSSTDLGTWRRIVILPFEAIIPPSEIITDFHSILIEREGGAILQWLIDGAVKFHEMGCDIVDKPAAVRRASAEYRASEDWVSNFIQEMCVPESDHHNETLVVRHTDLYHAYQMWAKNNGEYVRSSIAFGRALQASGWQPEAKWYDKERGTTTKAWHGLALLHDSKHFALVQDKSHDK